MKVILQNLKDSFSYRSLLPVSNIKGKYLFLENKKYINLSSNDYLGLSESKVVLKKARLYTKKYGTGGRSSRLVCGNWFFYQVLEEQLALWKGAESSLIFGSGYLANVGVLQALATLQTNILFIFDKLSHASLIDGVRLSQLKWCRFEHNDVEDLEKILNKYPNQKKIVITESIFSMEGDKSPIEKIHALCEKTNSFLYVDEAHSNGLFGEEGEGFLKQLLSQKKENLIVMGTFGKALGNYGAYICGTKVLKQFLINKARSLMYTTALPPSVIGGTLAAIDLIKKQPFRKNHVINLSLHFQKLATKAGIPLIPSQSQIVSILTISNEKTIALATYLRKEGFFAVGIRPPTVAKNKGRVRLTFNYFLCMSDIKRLLNCLSCYFNQTSSNA